MNSSYRWVIVALGGLMGCVAAGAMFSLAVFLGPVAVDTGWSRAAISSAMTVTILAMGFAGFFWGVVSDRYGLRPVALIGGVILGAGLWVTSRATSLLMFQFGFGVLVGFAVGAFFVPTIAAVTGWFDTQRALAVSLVSAGMGMAPMTMAPFAAWLVSHYDWRTAMATLAWLSWGVLIPSSLLLRRPPPVAPSAAAATQAEKPAPALATALVSLQFLVLTATFFFCCAAHSGPLFHFVSYAISCGVPMMAAVSIYGVEGLAGLGGRLLFGYAGDRLGVKRVLVAGLLLQAVAIFGYMFARRQSEFYLLAIAFGTAYSGVMPLYAVLAREYFDQRIMGTVFGAAIMISSLGMAFGPVIGGWIFDTYHDYRWLYMSSAALGLGAAAVACAFPSSRHEQPVFLSGPHSA
jgi:MFS family permease